MPPSAPCQQRYRLVADQEELSTELLEAVGGFSDLAEDTSAIVPPRLARKPPRKPRPLTTTRFYLQPGVRVRIVLAERKSTPKAKQRQRSRRGPDAETQSQSVTESEGDSLNLESIFEVQDDTKFFKHMHLTVPLAPTMNKRPENRTDFARSTMTVTLFNTLYFTAYEIPWDIRVKWAHKIVQDLCQIQADNQRVKGGVTLRNIMIDHSKTEAYIANVDYPKPDGRGCPLGWEPPKRMKELGRRLGISWFLGPRTELYQLGMVLWALAMSDPWPERHEPPLKACWFRVPEWYADVVDLCLYPQPRHRLAAEELLGLFPFPPTATTSAEYLAPKAGVPRTPEEPLNSDDESSMIANVSISGDAGTAREQEIEWEPERLYEEERGETESRKSGHFDGYERGRRSEFGQPEKEKKSSKWPEKAANDLPFNTALALKFKAKAQKTREVVKEKAREKEAHASNAKSRDREQRRERMDEQSSKRAYVEEDISSSDSDTATYASWLGPAVMTVASTHLDSSSVDQESPSTAEPNGKTVEDAEEMLDPEPTITPRIGPSD